MTPEQTEYFLLMLAKSKADAEVLRHARRTDPTNEYPFVRGLNAGLEQALMMFNMALAYDPKRPGRRTVQYSKAYGPHPLMKVDDDGSWVQITEEHA